MTKIYFVLSPTHVINTCYVTKNSLPRKKSKEKLRNPPKPKQNNMSGVFLKVLLVAVALGCLPWAIEVALRREFVVHREGVVVVSGASTGIGRDAALQLAELGYTVFAGVRSEKDAEGLRQAAPGSSHLVPTVFDVTKAEQLEALVVAVEKR